MSANSGHLPPAVLGIDPSLTATGIAYRDGTTATVKTRNTGDRRLVAIQEAVAVATDMDTRLAVLEDLPTHAQGAGLTGMVQGVIRVTLIDNEVPYVTIAPATLKKYATGSGSATKADMRMALYQRTGLDLRDDNQVDAWWLRAAGLQMLGHPVVTVPRVQVDALAKVKGVI